MSKTIIDLDDLLNLRLAAAEWLAQNSDSLNVPAVLRALKNTNLMEPAGVESGTQTPGSRAGGRE